MTPALGTQDGLRPAGIPKTTVALSTDWDVPFVSRLALNATGQWYSGVQLYAGNPAELPSRSDLSLGLRYVLAVAGKTTTLRATVTNALNQSRWIGNAYGDITKPAPRTVLLSGVVDF